MKIFRVIPAASLAFTQLSCESDRGDYGSQPSDREAEVEQAQVSRDEVSSSASHESAESPEVTDMTEKSSEEANHVSSNKKDVMHVKVEEGDYLSSAYDFLMGTIYEVHEGGYEKLSLQVHESKPEFIMRLPEQFDFIGQLELEESAYIYNGERYDVRDDLNNLTRLHSDIFQRTSVHVADENNKMIIYATVKSKDVTMLRFVQKFASFQRRYPNVEMFLVLRKKND